MNKKHFKILICCVLFLLTACSTTFDSFVLEYNRGEVRPPDRNEIVLFNVAPPSESSQLLTSANIWDEEAEEVTLSRWSERLKDVSVEKDKIIIETEDNTYTFDRLSESVAVDQETGLRYTYKENIAH